MKRVIAAIVIAATCATPVLAAETDRTVAGAARVIDGDSLVVGGVRIRILDVDAPESGQFCFTRSQPVDQGAWHCGRLAARALSEEIGDQKVSCDMTARGVRKGWLARCSVGGQDLAQWLAANGWAVPAPDCKCEVVRSASDQAKAEGRGIWSSAFTMPWDWRKAR
ncbi:MAG TPA: thermonuclease family protein [Dongiaceae bacterium]|nr:thermonuclease family protein [Dongiaceae bacterium]